MRAQDGLRAAARIDGPHGAFNPCRGHNGIPHLHSQAGKYIVITVVARSDLFVEQALPVLGRTTKVALMFSALHHPWFLVPHHWQIAPTYGRQNNVCQLMYSHSSLTSAMWTNATREANVCRSWKSQPITGVRDASCAKLASMWGGRWRACFLCFLHHQYVVKHNATGCPWGVRPPLEASSSLRPHFTGLQC